MTREGSKERERVVQLWVHPDNCRRAFQRFLTQVLTEVYIDLCSAVVFFETSAQLNEKWDFKSPRETSATSLTIHCSLHCSISTHTVIIFPSNYYCPPGQLVSSL